MVKNWVKICCLQTLLLLSSCNLTYNLDNVESTQTSISPNPIAGNFNELSCEREDVPFFDRRSLINNLQRNLVYADDGVREYHNLDLAIHSEVSPLIIFIHGGAFVGGSKMSPPDIIGYLYSKGFAVASINYRLAKDDGSDAHPTQIHDVKAAIRWLRANADRYKLDSEKFGLLGTSAGGSLVSLAGTSGNTAELEGSVGDHLEISSEVQAVVDYFGPVDFTTLSSDRRKLYGEAYNEKDIEVAYIGCNGENLASCDLFDLASVSATSYIDIYDPSFLIIHGDNDTQIPIYQSKDFFNLLKEKNGYNSSTFITSTGTGHGGGTFDNGCIYPHVLDFYSNILINLSSGKNVRI